MKRPLRRLQRYDGEQQYPSLDAHRRDRRRFLAGTAALVGGGALAACGRPFGSLHDEPHDLDGGMELPDFHRIRIPETGDRAVHLMDGGYARYYAVALTYTEDCALFAIDARTRIGLRFDALIAERTYDELATVDSATLDALREELRADLDACYNEDTGDVGTWWFQAVELEFTRLDAPELMGGVPRAEPSYP